MIEFYRLAGCPYCRRVRQKLEELDIEYEIRDVPAPRSDRDEVYALSGQRAVPVIVDERHGVDGMAESAEIVEYLDRTYGHG